MNERERSRPTRHDRWIGAGALALVLCCAGPALIAGGVLSAIGGAACDPIVIALGTALILAALAITWRRHRAGNAPCTPTAGNTNDPGAETSG